MDESSLDRQVDQSPGGEGSMTPESAVAAVREMIDMMASGGVKELDVRFGDVSIRLRSQRQNGKSPESTTAPPPDPSGPIVDDEDTHAVTAPMIGTFYVGPTPHDPPFVTPGDEVMTGQVVGIIEAMKIMNEIVADASGTVTEVVAENGQAVEYGSPLIRLAPLSTRSA